MAIACSRNELALLSTLLFSCYDCCIKLIDANEVTVLRVRLPSNMLRSISLLHLLVKFGPFSLNKQVRECYSRQTTLNEQPDSMSIFWGLILAQLYDLLKV